MTGDRATARDPRTPELALSQSSIVQLLHRNVQRFRGGLAFKAHRLVYHSPREQR